MKHHILEKINKILFTVIIPMIIVAVLLYIFLAPAVIQLNDSYYLTTTEQGGVIRVTGGSDVIGPGVVKVSASYPWVFGTVDDQYFLLDLEENRHEILTAREMLQKMNSNAIRLPHPETWQDICRSWHELQDSREAMSRLKNGLSKPVAEKKSLFF